MNEIDEKEIAPEQMKGVETFHLTAVVFGYNEMIREARTLGEKVYCRLARDVYIERLRAAGGNINIKEESAIILILGRDDAPSLALREKDIWLMRAAVAEWDAKQEKNGLVEDLKEAPLSRQVLAAQALASVEWVHEDERLDEDEGRTLKHLRTGGGAFAEDLRWCPSCRKYKRFGHSKTCVLKNALRQAGLR